MEADQPCRPERHLVGVVCRRCRPSSRRPWSRGTACWSPRRWSGRCSGSSCRRAGPCRSGRSGAPSAGCPCRPCRRSLVDAPSPVRRAVQAGEVVASGSRGRSWPPLTPAGAPGAGPGERVPRLRAQQVVAVRSMWALRLRLVGRVLGDDALEARSREKLLLVVAVRAPDHGRRGEALGRELIVERGRRVLAGPRARGWKLLFVVWNSMRLFPVGMSPPFGSPWTCVPPRSRRCRRGSGSRPRTRPGCGRP